MPNETKPAKTIDQLQLRWGLGGVIFSLSFSLCVHLLCPRSVSLLVDECGWSWTVIGPSRLRPLLTPDPSCEEEMGMEGHTPFKPDELSDVTAADG